MVSISADASTWSIGANYLRVRNSTSQELRFKNAGPHALLTYTEILGKALLSVSNGNSDAIEITDQIHLDRSSGPLDIGFTAAFNKGDAVCIFGQWAANATDGVAVMGLGVGCDETTGYQQYSRQTVKALTARQLSVPLIYPASPKTSGSTLRRVHHPAFRCGWMESGRWGQQSQCHFWVGFSASEKAETGC